MSVALRGLTKASGSYAAGYRRTYSRTYRFKSNDIASDSEAAVLAAAAAAGITLYSPHPYDSSALVTKIGADLASRITEGPDKGALWDVAVEYGPVNPLDQMTGGDPATRPIRYRLDPQTSERPLFKDYEGNPIVNTAGDYFDPPIVEEYTRYQLTVMRDEVAVNLPTLMALSTRPRTNDDVWNGFPEGTVKLLPLKLPERQWSQETGQLYWPMEYVFLIDFEGWQAKVLNQGIRRLATIGGATRQVAITDGMGQPVSTPCLLDDDGHPLAQPITDANIVVLEFQTCEPFDFSALDLDEIFA